MKERQPGDMEPHEILSSLIPRGKRREMARMLGVSESLVTKWMNEPCSDENPTGTGALNPIERIDRILDFAILYSPNHAQLIPQRFLARIEEHYARLMRRPLSDEEWRAEISGCLGRSTEVISKLLENAPASLARLEWEAARDQIELMVRRIEAGERAADQRR